MESFVFIVLTTGSKDKKERHDYAVKRKTAGRDTPAAEIQHGVNRDYISPSGGALKTRFADTKMDFIFSCLLS
jgi:hypothetical protein